MGLDNMSKAKLSEVLATRPDTRAADVKTIHDCLAWSNKTSGLVMWLMRKLSKGEALPNSQRKPLPGSYLDRQEKAKKEADRLQRNQNGDAGENRQQRNQNSG